MLTKRDRFHQHARKAWCTLFGKNGKQIWQKVRQFKLKFEVVIVGEIEPCFSPNAARVQLFAYQKMFGEIDLNKSTCF